MKHGHHGGKASEVRKLKAGILPKSRVAWRPVQVSGSGSVARGQWLRALFNVQLPALSWGFHCLPVSSLSVQGSPLGRVSLVQA